MRRGHLLDWNKHIYQKGLGCWSEGATANIKEPSCGSLTWGQGKYCFRAGASEYHSFSLSLPCLEKNRRLVTSGEGRRPLLATLYHVYGSLATGSVTITLKNKANPQVS